MYTVDETVVRGTPAQCFARGADVERWPEWLPHYRWVRFRRRDGFGTGLVEMAARRAFGPLQYPVWWVSEMHLDPSRPAVIYRHVDGITTGMDVEWSFHPLPDGTTRVRIVHAWDTGPRWPLPGAARRLIGLLQTPPEAWLRGGADEDFQARVEALLQERARARAAKDWPAADRIRGELTELGVEVMDGPQGATWRLKEPA
ncbi:MAG TPA: SRPBCC family protein [Longimicrobium sp.]